MLTLKLSIMKLDVYALHNKSVNVYRIIAADCTPLDALVRGKSPHPAARNSVAKTRPYTLSEVKTWSLYLTWA